MRLVALATAILTGVLTVPMPSPAADAAHCTLAKVMELPVRLEGGRVVADGTINGKPIHIILDTGSYKTLIPLPAARRLDLDPELLASVGHGKGIGGTAAMGSVPVRSLTIGDWRADAMNMQILDKDLGPNADLLLGQDFFSQADLELDVAHGMVRMLRPENCEDVPLAYWSDHYAEVPMRLPQGRRTGNELRVALNGYEFWAKLDTGAPSSSVQACVAHLAGVHETDPGVVAGADSHGIGKKAVPTWVGTFDRLTVGDEVLRPVRLRVGDFGGCEDVQRAEFHGMLLGLDFIRAHHIYLANGRGRAYLTLLDEPGAANRAPIFTPFVKQGPGDPSGERGVSEGGY
ncbi:gag-polyprotein putative aspartyl protease [Nitrospirillum amazonense]|uniref:Gag-polyprotein putative aspartyl protease n=1 Tax=Nitrospirillum amazonense TaxID=28077 RepID=A0A560FGM2_9PROT|nr:retropepsin-like aspartic protease [Nitrospirillum amazonense]TWB20762.1 gag-polyprotein putative aspartyl protease [Nitrospirillum amazonense]